MKKQRQLTFKREPDVARYEVSLQFIIDAWATVVVVDETVDANGLVGTKEELQRAVHEFLASDPRLDLHEFGFMYVLLRERGFPEEIIAHISTFFECRAPLSELCEAYRPRS